MEAVLMQQHIVGRGPPEDARHQAGVSREMGAEAGLVCTAHAQSCPGSRRVQP